MDVKKKLNTLGVILLIIAIVFQFLSPVKWYFLLASFLMLAVGGLLISKNGARKQGAIWSFVSEAFTTSFCLWMLIDFVRNQSGPVYYAVLCLVFDVLSIGASVLLLLSHLSAKNEKEVNPLTKYLNKKYEV